MAGKKPGKQLDSDNGWRGGATRRARSYKKLSLRCFKFEKNGVSYFLRFSFLSRKQHLSFFVTRKFVKNHNSGRRVNVQLRMSFSPDLFSVVFYTLHDCNDFDNQGPL